ncbi:hypothetical protein X943_001790 [Babesia divergens]|uniref:Uncharacterized protein n=1 Tax=Babesia divergens TaxID=32595 RepID=A0AAD9G718_BABDI|nr:hypothetical protein X943_001790 [Babesia divergens]
MATRKPISINLRDLQRVLNEGKPELPRYSSGAVDDNVEGTTQTTFGANRYKSADSRWANEVDDDDFDVKNPREERAERPEQDFSTVRSTANEFKRSETTSRSTGRGTSDLDFERKTDDDVWRSTGNRTNADETADDEVWRRSGRNKDSGTSAGQDAGQSKQGDRFGRELDDDEMFNRSTMRSDTQSRKLYVPPSKKNDGGAGSYSARNERFSCLEEPYERRNSNSTGYESNRAREVFSMQRREPDSQRDFYGGQQTRESYRGNTKSSLFGDSQKTGIYVPSFKRSQTYHPGHMSKPTNVHDIILKAAAMSEQKSKEENKKQTEPEPPKTQQSQVDLQLQQKREAVIRHNRMYEVNQETLKNLEDAVQSLLKGDHVNTNDLIPEDEQELVPAVVACILACKACESCSTMQDVHDKFSTVAPLLKALCERCEDPIEEKLLTEVAKIICHWKLPALSESVYLIEAVFDALLHCGIVTRNIVLHWLEHTADEVPDRINLILQLLPWKRWLLGESLQAPALQSEQESDESEEDIDIEALVPKPIRLSKTMMY